MLWLVIGIWVNASRGVPVGISTTLYTRQVGLIPVRHPVRSFEAGLMYPFFPKVCCFCQFLSFFQKGFVSCWVLMNFTRSPVFCLFPQVLVILLLSSAVNSCIPVLQVFTPSRITLFLIFFNLTILFQLVFTLVLIGRKGEFYNYQALFSYQYCHLLVSRMLISVITMNVLRM